MAGRVSMATRLELERLSSDIDRAAGPTNNGFWTSSTQLPAIIASMRSGCCDLALPVPRPPDNIRCFMAPTFGRRWWHCGRCPIAFARNG